tara:strand:- start:397 stop:3021 length:2625 start_codon:yes stop_codon:yes gene_type:complete
MGFAGQLFAARVAIGLAVPSPTAMTKAGGEIAKGISEIYKQAELAKNRGGLQDGYKAKLDKLNRTSTTAASKMNNEIAVRLERNLDRLNQATGNSIGRSFDKVKGHYTSLKKVLSKPMKDQLFGGMGGLAGMDAAKKMASNMEQMSQAGRTEAIRQQGTLISGLEKELDLERQKHREMAQTTKAQIKKANYQKGIVTEKQKELQIQQQIKGNLEKIDAELGGIQQDYSGINVEADKFGEKVVGTTDAIRNKFNAALRTSVSLLTVVGYKLNQSGQELISFERELLNANSVFNLTNDTLFEVGNTVTEFGNNFGIATQNGAEGLYQLASAGVEVEEALSILPETLKLSMAVQGDHNTISKLTAQTLFGFGMEMDQAAEITDKFAYAIQKSLIEYQDLSSAVKFALPFFTSTGQSLDQLLGALQILTNRALEAGIAGRGLRQALAEFAESAMDAEAGFRKMGVEILNSKGEMLQLSEIAERFAVAVGVDTVSNTELLTTLIEDLNVRGATAFIHLVQASDEFTQAVEDTTNAGGQLDEMVKIQNQSLQAQIQILKTNIFSIFALRDANYEGTEFMNSFHEALVTQIATFKDLIIMEKDGKQQLTEFGKSIQDFATGSLVTIIELIHNFVEGAIALSNEGFNLARVMDILAAPLKVVAYFFKEHPTLMKWLLIFKAVNVVLPIQTALVWGLGKAYAYLATTAMTASIATGGVGGGGMIGGRLTSKGITKSKTTGRYMVPGRAGRGFKNKGDAIKAMGKRVGGKGLGKTAGKWGLKRIGAAALLGGSGIGGLVLGGMLAYDVAKATGVLASGGYTQGMAGGGGLSGGKPYLVGEQGPEMFVPGQSGQVLNNAQTNDILGSKVVFRDVTIGIDSFGGIS